MSKQLENAFPSVDLAYEFVTKSYEWVQQRADKIDDRIQTLIAWVSSTNLAVLAVVLTRTQALNFRSFWMWLSLILYMAGLMVAWYARLYGEMRVMNLKLVYDKSLGLSPWEFKRDVIYFAGQAFEHNRQLISMKGRLAIVATLLFLSQGMSMAVWMFRT